MKHRGISQIIGSLIMLAIVVSLGTLILFTGLESITELNSFIDIASNQQTESLNERLIIEHVRFPPDGSNKIELYLRNTGSIDITLDRITINQIESQQAIIFDTDPDLSIFSKELKSKNYTDWISTGSDIADSDFIDQQYSVSVTTSRGNTFKMVAEPFNT